MQTRVWFASIAFVVATSFGVHSTQSAGAAAGAPADHYQIINRFVLGGDGGWDYIAYDTQGDRLFVSRATRVMVVDPVKGSLIAEIPGTLGVHGIAFDYELGKGFTSNGKENTVTVFDLKTLKETAKVKTTGDNPDAIVYDSFSKRVFTFNGRSHNATAINAQTNEVVGTIALGGKPEFANADGTGKLFVNLEDKSQLCSIDTKKLKVLQTWSLAPGEEPSGLAMDMKTRRLFSVCDNKLMIVLNADTGKVIEKLPIGAGVDAAGFDPDKRLIFSSNGGDGTLTVVHEDSADKFSVIENVPTQKSARTLAVNPKTHTVYLPAAEFEAAAPGAEQPKHHRNVKAGTFTILVLSDQAP